MEIFLFFGSSAFFTRLLLIFLFTSLIHVVLHAAPLQIVSNTNDFGAGSLRQALQDVDENGDIVFNIPGVGPHTIVITDSLFITKSLTINGPGANLLTIDGAGGGFRGIQIVDGLDTNSNVIISGITLDGGVTGFGGILSGENLTLNNSVVTGYGNAIVNFGATSEEDGRSILNINNSLITGNSNIGIFSLPGQALTSPGGEVTINQTTVSNNGGPGVALFGPNNDLTMGSRVALNKSIISANRQGIVNEGANAPGATGGTLEVYNSTITNNNGDGIQTNGGTNGGSGATTRVSSSTITGNSFIGLINFGTNPLTEVKNSIVSQNAVNDCEALDGTFTPLGMNFSTDNTCPAGFTQVAPAALNLGPLQNNGGPTDTHALISPSVAIDAVTDCTFINGAPVLEDQRGFFRPPTNCDAGAFELGASPTIVRNVPAMSQLGVLFTAIIIGIAGIVFYIRRNRELV